MDLSEALKALFRGEKVDDPVYPTVLHRMLVSERAFAPAVKAIAKASLDAEMMWEIWRHALPRTRNPPYLRYAAPPRQKDPNLLEKRLMEVHAWNREEAEQALVVVQASDDAQLTLAQQCCAFYGVDFDAYRKTLT